MSSGGGDVFTETRSSRPLRDVFQNQHACFTHHWEKISDYGCGSSCETTIALFRQTMAGKVFDLIQFECYREAIFKDRLGWNGTLARDS
jgi:hypothetical protein